MRNTLAAVAAAPAALLLLAGCSAGEHASSSGGATLPPSSSAASTSPPAPTPADPSTNSRGNRVKALGQEAGFGQDPAHAVLSFTVDSIAPVKCTGVAAETPSNGHFIAAHFRVATGPAAEFNQLGVTEINPTAFSFVGPDNLTVSSITSAGTYSCLPDAQNLPGNFGPGQQYAGDIVFDLPATHGALIYHPDQGSGWEWDF